MGQATWQLIGCDADFVPSAPTMLPEAHLAVSATITRDTSVKRKASSLSSYKCSCTTTAVGSISFGTYLFLGGYPQTAAPAEVFVGFYFRYGTKPASNYEVLLQLFNSSTAYLALALNSSGNLEVRDATNSYALQTTGSATLSASTWYRVEVQYKTDGTFAVRVNGSADSSGTQTNFSAVANGMAFGKPTNSNSQTVEWWFDDIISKVGWSDGDWRCHPILPNGTYTNEAATGDYTNVAYWTPNESTPATLGPGTFKDFIHEWDNITLSGSEWIQAVKSFVTGNTTVTNKLKYVRSFSGGTAYFTPNGVYWTSSYTNGHRIDNTDTTQNTVGWVRYRDPKTNADWTQTNLNAFVQGIRDFNNVNADNITQNAGYVLIALDEEAGGGGPTIVYGAGAVSAAASLTADGIQTHIGSGAIAASASVTADGLQTHLASAAVSASASVTASGGSGIFGAAAVSAAASLTASGQQTHLASAGVSASAAVTCAANQTHFASADVSAAASVFANAGTGIFASAAVSAAASVTANGTQTSFGQAAITGAASLTAAGTASDLVLANVVAAAIVAADGYQTHFASAAVVGGSSISTSALLESATIPRRVIVSRETRVSIISFELRQN